MRVSGIELRLLRDFVAVVEQRSFRAAAVKMHVSQPPLSFQIANLEKELGARLFERRGKLMQSCNVLSIAEATGIPRETVRRLRRAAVNLVLKQPQQFGPALLLPMASRYRLSANA